MYSTVTRKGVCIDFTFDVSVDHRDSDDIHARAIHLLFAPIGIEATNLLVSANHMECIHIHFRNI